MIADAIDKKILYRLHKNARSAISTLSKETGFTREIVAYRMKKLEEEGIIKGYIAKINQAYFCEGIGTAMFKLFRSDDKRFREIIKFLQNHPAVNWMAELSGTADIVVTILYKNSEDLANIVAEITQFIGNNLKEHSLSLYITEYKFERQGIIHLKPEQYPPEPIISFGEKKRDMKFDKNDLIILQELAKNCRAKNIDLAKKTSLGEDMVRLKIKRLEQNKVIFGYTIVLDVSKYGFEAYYLGLQLEQFTKEAIGKIKYYVHANPYIGYCARAAGKYNIIMTLYAKDRKHFSELLLDIRNQFGALLLDYEFQLDLQEYKEIFVPEGFLIS